MARKFNSRYEFFYACQVGDEFLDVVDRTERGRRLYVATKVSADRYGRRVVVFDCVTTAYRDGRYVSSLAREVKASHVGEYTYTHKARKSGPQPVALLPYEDAPRFSMKRLAAIHRDAVAAYRTVAALAVSPV